MMNDKEAVILKTMNIDEQNMVLGLTKLNPEDFITLEGKLIFNKLKERFQTGKKPSLFLAINELNDKYADNVQKALDKINNIDPDLYEFEELVNDLKVEQSKKFFKSKIEETLKGLDKGMSIEYISSKITEYACQLSNGTQVEINGSQLSDDIMEDARQTIEEKNKDLIRTSYETINNCTGGGYSLGELHMIAAGSGVGKTTIACNILRDVALIQGIPSLWVNTEMIKKQMLKRWQVMLPPNPLINSSIIGSKTLNEEEIFQIEKATEMFRKKDGETYFQADCQELTPENLEFLIQKYIFKGVRFIVVDYIGNIELQNTKDKQGHEILTAISKKLARMAKKYNVCILVLAQLTDEGTLQGARAMKNALDSLMHIEELPQNVVEKLEGKLDELGINSKDYNNFGFPFRHRFTFSKARNASKNGEIALLVGSKSLFLDKKQAYQWLNKYGAIAKNILSK